MFLPYFSQDFYLEISAGKKYPQKFMQVKVVAEISAGNMAAEIQGKTKIELGWRIYVHKFPWYFPRFTGRNFYLKIQVNLLVYNVTTKIPPHAGRRKMF